jgi:hypothetical protein
MACARVKSTTAALGLKLKNFLFIYTLVFLVMVLCGVVAVVSFWSKVLPLTVA